MLIDSKYLPDSGDLELLLSVARAGAFALDRTTENAATLDRLLAKGLINEPRATAGRVFLSRRGEAACIALTGSCPEEEQPADMKPFLLGPA